MPLDLIAELEHVVERLAEAGVEYAICGGLAVAIHGHPRATMDIDLLVQPEQVPLALAAAQAAGFDIPARLMTFGLRTATPRQVQRVSKLDPDTGALLSLDLLLVGPTLDDVWRGRIAVTWRGRAIWLVSRDGLATMKRLAGRPQDLADLAALEGVGADDVPDEDGPA